MVKVLNSYRIRAFTIAITASTCLFLFLPMSFAVAINQSVEQGSLTLSPLRTEREIAPGTSKDSVLTISNTTNDTMIVYLSAEAFSVINQQYDYAFDKETELSKWVNFESDTVTLEKGATKSIAFTIGVPLSAEPGGRYLSLFASSDVTSGESGINSRQRVASLVYITVTGDVSRVGALISLNSPLLITGNSSWITTIQNSGSTHFRSRYNVNVRNLIGNDSVASSSGEALILPGTVRLIDDTLPAPPLPGIYKVVYTIGLGDTPGKVETRYILYMPPVTIVIFMVALILGISLISQRKSRKKSNPSGEQPYK